MIAHRLPDHALRILVWALAAACGAGLAARPALAHATLVAASPARRAVVARSPERVELHFSEQLEQPFATLSVRRGDGQQVDLRDVRVDRDDPRRLSVGVPALAPGAYTVRYRVLSVDGHVTEGEYRFTVKPPQ